MAGEGQRIPYIIEMIADDTKLRQQLSKWDWESIMGVKGKGFSDTLVSDAKDAKDQVRKVLGGLNLNWKEILGADDMVVFEQGLARVIQGAKKEIRYFGDKKDTAGIERTMEYLTALGEEFASIGSTFDAKQIARSMNSLVSVLNTLEVSAERLKTSFTTLFSKGTATSLNTIATAMASIGVDKSQITSMKRAREEMEKLAKSSTIKLDIDYGSLSSDELLKALRTKHKAKTANLNDLLDFEWSDITVQLPEITNLDVRRKQLLAIIELEKRIMKETGKSPVNEYFEEDTALRNMAEVKEEFNELTKVARESSKEILNQFKQSAKDIKTAIAEELGKLADVKVSLTLDEASKKSFAQSVNNFVGDFNNKKYGEIEPVKIDLIPNEPEKTTNRGRPLSASKDQIKKATTDIQKELDLLQKEYDEVDNLLNNKENGLLSKVNPDKPNKALNTSIANAEAKLKALEKQMISYKYILSNMDDYEFAKHIASDWKRFASAEEVILTSQNKLLDRTQKWRNEMNNLLRFKYTWKIEGTEDEFAGLESALIDLTDNHPIRLTPDIDFLANAIEEGLAKKQINVKLTADGPVSVSGVVGNLGIPPVMVVGQPPKSASTTVVPTTPTPKVAQQPQPQPKTPTPPQTVTRSYTDVDTDIATIIEFVEKQVERNRELRVAYAELLKDLGITDEGVSAFLDNVKNGKTTIPKGVASKHGSEELLLQKLRRQKEDVSFNSKNPFFSAANDILKLKDVIANNPNDQAKVKEASDQIKSLLMKSIVDSFKNYFKTSEEDKNKYLKDIQAQEAARTAAMAKYNSEPERQKRKEIIASKQRQINELQSNTAIAEYEKIVNQIEEAKTNGDWASVRALQEQERQALPAVKQGYQDLIKLRRQLEDSNLYQISETERKISELEAKTNKSEQEVQNLIRLRNHLSKLQWENTDDANLIAARDAQNAIKEKKNRVANIDRRREAYDSLFSLDEIKKLIDSGNEQGLSEFIMKEILSKSDIAESMGRHKKTEGCETNSIKAFDTMSQRLITATVGLVQKALGIAQEATEELDTRVRNEGLIDDLKKISKRKNAVDAIYGWGTTPKSESEFTGLKNLFKEDFQHAKQAESSKTATDRDRAYIRFANALDEATEAAEAYRTVYNEWTDKERSELLSVGDKEGWFNQKYENPEDAARNYQLYTNYNKAVDTLKESVNKPKDASGNATGEGVSHDLKRQLQGYVFRVTLVDQNGATVTTDVGTQRLVEGGKLSKPNKSYNAGSRGASVFLSNLDPSQAQDIKVYKFPGSRNNADQPVVDATTSPTKPNADTAQVVRRAKQVIDSHKRVIDESKNVITAQEELESANSGLDRANTELKETQRRMSEITGGKDADEYIQSLHSKKQQPKTVVENKMDNIVKPLSNAIFEETNSAISEETDNIARAILIDNNPLDAIKIPDITKRIMEIVNERRTLKDQPQTDATKAQLQKLRDEEKSLMAPWAESPEARQLLFGDLLQLDVLTEQLRKKPNDEKLKSDVEQLKNKIVQRMHLYEELLGTLPKEVLRLDDISKQKKQINQTLPKSVEEATAMQQQVQELSNQENIILQSVHQWKDNIKQQGQAVIDSVLKKQGEQGAPALAQEYQKQIGELVNQAVSLSAQLEADPNNEGLKTQLQGIVNAISKLTIHYKDLLEKYHVATNGFLGNKAQSQVEAAQKVLSNPLDQSLWGEFDEVPDAVKRRYELYQRSDILFKEKRDASEGRRQEIEREMQSLAQQDKEEKELVLSWIQSLRERTGTGIFAGLGDDNGHLKTITDLRAQLFGTKAEASTTSETNESSSRLSELKELKVKEAAQKLAIENERERVALAERRLAIERELTDATITTERHAELTAELQANRNRAVKLGVRVKKFADVLPGSTSISQAYIDVVNGYIDLQRESDEKIAKLQSEIVAQNNRLGALKAPRTEEAVKEGRRRTQNRAIESVIKQKAENLKTTDPDDYARIVELVEDEISVTDFYDRMNPYAAYEEELARRIQKKSEEYVREMISLSPAEQQRIVDEAIAMQEEAIKVKEAELAAERARNNQIVEEREKYKIEGQVTDEMIAARRNATTAIGHEAQFVQRTVEEMVTAGDVIETTAEEVRTTYSPTSTSGSTSDVHYQNYTGGQAYQYGGGVYGIDTSLLATEETLNAIYTLLNGSPRQKLPMSDERRKALEDELVALRGGSANGPLKRNNTGDNDVPPITPMNRRTPMDDLRMADEAENAAKLLHSALSELDPRHSSVDVLIDAYKNLGQEVLDAEKLLLNPEYAGALETAQIASMGIEEFPDVDESLRKLKYLRARVGSDTITGIDAQRKPLISQSTETKSEITPTTTQETQKTAESLMTVGKAINIINKAIGESTAKTATGMAKAYANKIHDNQEAVEAAKLLYNTPDSELTTKFGKNTKAKLKEFRDAWYKKKTNDELNQQARLDMLNRPKGEKPKVTVEPVVEPGAVAQAVKENVAQTPAKAEVHQTTSYGGDFDGTTEEWQEVLALLNEMSVAEDVQPTAKSGDLIRARWNEVSGDFTKAEYDELVATFGEPLEKMVIASEKQVKNEEKKVEASNQQLQNEQAKKEETAEQLKNEQTESNVQIANTEALKAREAEIVAQLEADDKLKATRSSDNTSGGGLIGVINELAKESTLVKVLNAIGEIAKKQVASVSGKGNSAQDLLVRLQKMLALGIDQKKERVAYMDLATGAMTDSVEGSNTIVDSATFEALRNAYRDAVNFNAQVHTHADEPDPYFSQADLKQFANDAAIGIRKQILLSRDSMTVLDMEGAQDVEGLLNALSTTEQTFEALSNTAAQFGATYLNSSFNDMTPQGLVKMLGIKGVESKYTEAETRESTVKGMLAEDAKVAADMLQESTGRAVKRTVERVGAELMTTTEKIDAKGNKTWSKQISDKYTKAAWATNDAFTKLGLDKEFGVGTDAQLALTEYTNRYAEFVKLSEEFKNNQDKEGLQAQFNELIPKLDEAEEKLNKLIQTKDKFLGNKEAIGIFDHTQVATAGDNLKALATQRYAQGGIGLGENIAFNGISDTQFGTRLLVDVLKNGTIKQYALEVDKATGNVKEFMLSETALANAFQNVNKAMRYNETVMAKVAIGDNPTQQEAFMNSAKSPEWNAYKKALATMEKYVAHIWNRMAQGGRGASQKELDYIMTLSENVLELGKNVSKTSGEFKTFWDQNPSDVTALNIKIKKRGKNVLSRDEQVRAEMEKLAQTKANASGQRYAFSSFDNDTLKYKLTDLSGNIRNVTMVWSELYGQVATISDKSISEVDTLAGKVEKLKNKFEEAEAVGYLNGKNKDLAAFKKQLEDIDNAVKNGDTFENIEAMRQKAIALGDRISKVVNQTKSMMVGTGAKKSVDNQYDKIVGTMQGLPDELRPDFGAKNNAQVVQQYIDAYKQLNKDYQKYVDNNKINNPKIQQQLKQQAVHVQMLGKKLLSSATQAGKLSDLVEQSGFYIDKNTGEERNLGGVTSVTAQELGNLEGKMRDYVQNGLRQANIEGAKFDTVNQKMTYTFRTSKNTVADMVVQYNKATKSLYAYQKQERESLTGIAGFLQTMKVKTRSILQYVTSMTSIYRVWGMLRQGVQYIKEIDKALVELRKVTNETEATYDRFLQTASKTASKLGSTISAVTEATATFAKLGYTMEQASEMAEAAIVYKNVGDGISNAEDAADSIISTLKGFRLEASETMRIVDRFNEVKPASLYSDVYDKDGYIGKTLETDNSEERFKSVN